MAGLIKQIFRETGIEEHRSLMDTMRDNFGKHDEPRLGFFWYDVEGDELFGVNSTLASLVPYNQNGRRTEPLLHKTFWQKEFHKAKSKGKTTRFSGDYTVIPRGRIFQYEEDGHFEIMVGEPPRQGF